LGAALAFFGLFLAGAFFAGRIAVFKKLLFEANTTSESERG